MYNIINYIIYLVENIKKKYMNSINYYINDKKLSIVHKVYEELEYA